MPLYPYSCDSCDHTFDALVTAATVIECPACESKDVTRGFGIPAKTTSRELPATNCRGDGPPCALPQCGRRKV